MAEIIYSKFSNERSREFAVRTDILEENGVRYVMKTALYPEGKQHEKNLLRWYRELKTLYAKIPYECNVCEEMEEGVRLEYVTGQTLEELLDGMLAAGKVKEAEKRLGEYLKLVERIYTGGEFFQTEEFRSVFGEADFTETLSASSVTNIDMVCGNLVLAEVPVILDYEWTFDFPIPVKYVLYRIIHYYTETNMLRKEMDASALYKKFGIREELQDVFASMERHFQKYITGKHIPVRDMYRAMSPGVSGSQDTFKYLQVFFSDGGGYTERNSVKLAANDGSADYVIPIPETCREIRLDPGDGPCIVKVEKLSFDGVRADLRTTVIPEGYLSGEWIYIAKNDPNISDIKVPAGAGQMEVCLKIYAGEEDMIRGLIRQTLSANEKITRQENLIREMEGTKVWKLYQKYRKRVERKS